MVDLNFIDSYAIKNLFTFTSMQCDAQNVILCDKFVIWAQQNDLWLVEGSVERFKFILKERYSYNVF